MNVLVVVPALGVALAATVAYAQAPPPAPATQTPPTAAPPPQGQTPALAPQPEPLQLPPPFKGGFKYGYIRFQVVAQASAEGRKATSELKALQESREREIIERQKSLQTQQQRLERDGAVMSDAARAQLQTEIERQGRDIQRMVEDAQQDIERLSQQLQAEFSKKMNPIIAQLGKEKGIDLIFDVAESGLVWAAEGLDLTTDLIQALDRAAGAKPAAAAPAAPAPADPAAGK